MKYLRYLRYVLRHKWFVFIECCKLGVPFLGLVHDWTKLLPSEFLPYADHFYSGKHDIQRGRDSTGYYKPTDTGDAAFDWAWFLHARRNKHHWQWWVLGTEYGGIKVLEMPLKYRKEMIADWRGAGKALGTPNTPRWYIHNGRKMGLGPETRQWIERELTRQPEWDENVSSLAEVIMMADVACDAIRKKHETSTRR